VALDPPPVFGLARREVVDACTTGRGTAASRAVCVRHTSASWAIAAGLPMFEIGATMGTSLEQLSTYAHLLPDSADRARVALDAFLASSSETFGHGTATPD
jgi:hypothetical protein